MDEQLFDFCKEVSARIGYDLNNLIEFTQMLQRNGVTKENIIICPRVTETVSGLFH